MSYARVSNAALVHYLSYVPDGHQTFYEEFLNYCFPPDDDLGHGGSPMTRMLHCVLCVVFMTVMALATGCADVLAFDLYAAVDEFTVPGDASLHHGKAPLSAATIPDMEIQFSAMDARSVSISSVRFFVTDTDLFNDADADDLDFLDSVIVYIAPMDPSSDLPVVELARWDGPHDAGTQELWLDALVDVDLTDYIQEGFVLKASTTGVVPYDDVSVSGEATFRVNPI